MPSEVHLAIGLTIVGKWQQNRYRIVQFLGEGANGRVYLVEQNNTLYAMKLGFSTFDLQSEINVLKLIETQRIGQPYFIEADDVHVAGKDYPFYVMSYIKGERIDYYIAAHGFDWFYVIGSRLLDALCHLHRHGWVFGDLNIDNVLITEYGGVELIDYGGVTQQGRAVKQFTELNDRGYWQAGSREADEGYDLFAFTILCLQCLGIRFPTYIPPEQRHTAYLLQLLRSHPHGRSLFPFVERAVGGQFRSSQQASALWRQLILQRETKHPLKIPVKWLTSAFFISAGMFIATVYYVIQ